MNVKYIYVTVFTGILGLFLTVSEADEVDIAAKHAGRVKEILAREGDLVHPGEVLGKMDTDELKARLAKAEAEVSRFHVRPCLGRSMSCDSLEGGPGP